MLQRLLLLLAAVAASTAPARAQEATPTDKKAVPAAAPDTREAGLTLAGSGIISLPDTSTLPRGRFAIALDLNNQDRDPLRLDVLDLSLAWIGGLGGKLETYGHAVVSRAVAVSPRQSLFPSPIDLVVPEGYPVPRRPYYPVYPAFPYVNRKGNSQLGRFTPGDLVFGVKRTLIAPGAWAPGLALSGEVKLPMTRSLADLQSGSGTGGIDERVRVTAESRGARTSVLASVSYAHVGQPAWGDRLIVYRPAGGVSVTEQPLELSNELGLGLGLRRMLRPRLALVAEVTKMMEVGGHTPTFREAGPIDVTAGLQTRWKGMEAMVCLRYHANSVGHLGQQAYPLAGLADMTDVSDADLESYLRAIGALDARPFLRHRGQTALAFPADGPGLPPGARILPSDFTVTAHDVFAYELVWAWGFGRSGKPRRD